MSLKQLLTERRDEILAKFLHDVAQKQLPPEGVSRSVLIDHIPLFLDEILEEIERDEGRVSRAALEIHQTARQHGEQRWETGYDLESVVREYGVLRHAFVEVAKNAGVDLTIDEFEQLARYLNLGIAGAASQYVRSREEQLRARQSDLEFLVEAGELLGSSLDFPSTLSRLTRLLVPRLADYCIVHLQGAAIKDVAIAHAKQSGETLLREVLRAFPALDFLPTHAEVLRTGKPVLVESVPEGFFERTAQTADHLTQLRLLNPCSWLVVPLLIKSNIIGTMTIAWSESQRHYSSWDLLLVSELARRAASAIDNAQLYELSRTQHAIAEAATRTKDEFVAVVTHELRTPLNVIIGWIRLLRSGSVADKTREHALEVIERNANAQSQLVADLLDISRVLTGKVRLEPAQVDLAHLLALVLEDARLAIESKRLQLHTDIADSGTLMRGDAERLKQIVWNLLLNAIKFTPKGGQIWVTLRRVESDLELTFKDNGVGLAADFMPYLFDSFRQFDAKITRMHGGLGIGLSITKHLVELHGGSVEAVSEGVGKGATFTVRLPLSPVISTTVGVTKMPAATTERRLELARHTTLVGKSVLVVDNEDDARDLLRTMLESRDMIVYDAGSAREALELIASTHIDLIVSDIGMPEQDGFSLVRQIRAQSVKEKSSIPALALTAFARNEDRTRALLEGFNVHMAKPVAPAELLTALADLIGRAAGRIA
jgi:signal transduction histidine kinase/CheY-like chemotaxis protein